MFELIIDNLVLVCVSIGEPVCQDTPSASAATPLKEGNNRMRQAAFNY